jgi:hypothetical protein
MKKLIYLSSLGLFLLASCTKDLTSLNDETKKASVVPPGSLFTNASRTLSTNLASASVNTNVFRFVLKHWAMVTYQDEVQYDFTTRAIPNSWWNAMYRDVMIDLQNASVNIAADPSMEESQKLNQMAVIDVLQVYAFSVLVNTFGNVPYTEALNANILFPKYDDPKTVIYPDLMKRLTDDISKMNVAAKGFTSTEDLINKGNMVKWKKFAATLQFRLAIILADVENSVAKATVEAVNGEAISSPAENSSMDFLDGSPSQNPLYVDIVTGGRGDYVAAKDFVDSLLILNDPRLPNFFGTNSSGIYQGGIVGAVNSPQSAYSQPGAKVIAANAPNIFFDYVEAEFLRAEAVERGYSIPGTAAEHYDNAITASILAWGGTPAQATAYLANPAVAYATAAGTWRQKIGTQKWIALFNRPYDGWVEIRRLDYPKMTPPVAAKSGFPTRFTYSSAEQTTNGESYTEAAAAVGGDEVTTKLFWDVN